MFNRFIVILFCFFPIFYFSQSNVYSPFSISGIGDIHNSNHAVFSILGNTYSSYSDSNNLNIFQPASYSLLGKGQPLFSFGMNSTFYSFWENGSHFTKRNTSIHHFAIGIPFAKIIGIGFGLKPFSSKGFNIIEKVPFTDDTLLNQYSYTGNTNQAFIGISAKILKSKKNNLSIGIQTSYIFGNTKDRRSSQLVSQKFALIADDEYQLKALKYDFGVHYSYNLQHDRQIHFGIIYSPAQKLTAFRNISKYSAIYAEDESSYSLIENVQEKSKIQFPSILDIGVSYIYRPIINKNYSRKNIPQFQIFSKFSTQNWNEYRNDFSNIYKDSVKKSISFSLAFEYAPHFNSQDRNKSITYISKIRYRLAWEYYNLPNIIKSNKFTRNTLSAGFLFPISNQKTLSSISIGFYYQNINSENKSFWTEKNLGINFGVQIAPGFYDKWFKKYKID